MTGGQTARVPLLKLDIKETSKSARLPARHDDTTLPLLPKTPLATPKASSNPKKDDEQEERRQLRRLESAASVAMKDILREARQKQIQAVNNPKTFEDEVGELAKMGTQIMTTIRRPSLWQPQPQPEVDSDSESDTTDDQSPTSKQWKSRKLTRFQMLEESLRSDASNPDKLAEAEKKVAEHKERARQRRVEMGQDYIKSNRSVKETVTRQEEVKMLKQVTGKERGVDAVTRRKELLQEEQTRKEEQYKAAQEKREAVSAMKDLSVEEKARRGWLEVLSCHCFVLRIHSSLLEHHRVLYKQSMVKRAMTKIRLILPFWIERRRKRKKNVRLLMIKRFFLWIGKARRRFKRKSVNMIFSFFGVLTFSSKVALHVQFWVRSVKKLQGIIRRHFAMRQHQLQALTRQWDRYEPEIIASIKSLTGRRASEFPAPKAKGKGKAKPEPPARHENKQGLPTDLTPCPDHIKKCILLENLRQRSRKHKHNVRVWQQLLQEHEKADTMPEAPQDFFTPSRTRTATMRKALENMKQNSKRKGDARPHFQVLLTTTEIKGIIESYYFDRSAFNMKFLKHKSFLVARPRE